MLFAGFVSLILMILKIGAGALLIIGGGRGLVSGEGKYDKETSQWMNMSQITCIILGLWLVANAFGYFTIPFIPFF